MIRTILPYPVSQKAYCDFLERISIVFPDLSIRVCIIAAMDKYLEGDRLWYTRELAPEYVMAFEMLRFDIDLAISRSEKAKERARRRKEARMAQAKAVEEAVTDASDASDIEVKSDASDGGTLPADDTPEDMPSVAATVHGMQSSEPSAQDVEDMGESLRKFAGEYWAEREAQRNCGPVTKTRRQRRAEQRTARTKTRWRKL